MSRILLRKHPERVQSGAFPFRNATVVADFDCAFELVQLLLAGLALLSTPSPDVRVDTLSPGVAPGTVVMQRQPSARDAASITGCW